MEACISGSKRVVIGDAGHCDVSGKAGRIQPSGDRFHGIESLLRWTSQSGCGDFWVAQRFSAALGDSLGLGLQPLRFYQRQHVER
jgi:hypothetical protein